jgi:hypothetical protein
MFPENVRDRLMEDALQDEGKTSAGGAVRDETNAFFPEVDYHVCEIFPALQPGRLPRTCKSEARAMYPDFRRRMYHF